MKYVIQDFRSNLFLLYFPKINNYSWVNIKSTPVSEFDSQSEAENMIKKVHKCTNYFNYLYIVEFNEAFRNSE